MFDCYHFWTLISLSAGAAGACHTSHCVLWYIWTLITLQAGTHAKECYTKLTRSVPIFWHTDSVWTTLLDNERHIWELKILKDISYDTFFKRNFEKIIILRLNKSIYFMLINNTDAISFNIENINWRFFDVAFSCTANMLDGDFAYSVIRNLLNYLRKTNPIPFLNSSMHLKCCSTALRP